MRETRSVLFQPSGTGAVSIVTTTGAVAPANSAIARAIGQSVRTSPSGGAPGTQCGLHFGMAGHHDPTKKPQVTPDQVWPDIAHAAGRARIPVYLKTWVSSDDGARHEQRRNGQVEPVRSARLLAQLALARLARVEVGRGGRVEAPGDPAGEWRRGASKTRAA